MFTCCPRTGNKIYCTDTGRTPSQVWMHDAVNGDGDVDVILTLPYWKFTGIYATKTKNNEGKRDGIS